MDARLFVLRKQNLTSNRHGCPDTSITSVIASVASLRDRLAILQNSGGAVPRSCPLVAAPRAGARRPRPGDLRRLTQRREGFELHPYLFSGRRRILNSAPQSGKIHRPTGPSAVRPVLGKIWWNKLHPGPAPRDMSS